MRERLLDVVVREGDPIPLPRGARGERIRRRLRQATARLPFEALTERRGQLRAAGAVGLIDVAGARVVIHPKATGGEPPGKFLTDLLWASGVAPWPVSRAAALAAVRDGMPEAVVRAVADDMVLRLRHSLPRRYEQRDSLSPVLRGRVDFKRLATAPPARDYLLPVRYAPLHPDNALARLLRALVGTLMASARTPGTRLALDECDRLLGRAKPLPLTHRLVDTVTLTRFEEQWRGLHALAAELVRSRSPSPVTPAATPGIALLFELNHLFEALLRNALPEALAAHGLELSATPSRPRLLRDPASAQEYLRLRPDYLLVDRSGGPVAVADAKWKVLAPSGPGHGLASADAYQVATYMTRHGVDRGIVFFPRVDWMPRVWCRTAEFLGGGGAELRLVGVDTAGLVSRNARRRARARTELGRVTREATAP